VKAVSVPRSILNEMKTHARETYPDECCGFLIGGLPPSELESTRGISTLVRAQNEFDGERRRRFLIRPEELRDMERRTEREGRAILGFYHSHPDHPARPSLFDQEHAWPWYAYIVLSVTATDVPEVGAFELDADSSTFHSLPLEVFPTAAPSPGVAGG